MRSAVWIFALLLAGWAGWLDWRSRRIPNWLTGSGLIVGLVANTVASGWSGTKVALEGAGLGLVLLLPFVLLRGLGAGDWKLIGALGAFLGPKKILLVLLESIFIAGLMAIVEMIRKRRVKQTLVNLGVLVHAFVTFGLRPRRGVVTLDNPGVMTLPFGVAAALGTIIFFCAESASRIF